MFSRNEKPKQVGKICEIILSPFLWQLSNQKAKSWSFRYSSLPGFNLAISSDIKSTCAGQAKCTKLCCHRVGREQVVTIPAEAVFVMENSSLGEVWWNEISFTPRETWWAKEFAELSTNWKLRTPCIVVAWRQWHPTPVLLPGKSHGRRSLVGCSPWDR